MVERWARHAKWTHLAFSNIILRRDERGYKPYERVEAWGPNWIHP